jgi:hypothetical protein
MRRFILHCGANKTGTSAFQDWLVHNRDKLLQSNILFPVSGISPWGNGGSLAKALAGHKRHREGVADKLVPAFEAELAAAPDRDVLLSAEVVCGDRFLPDVATLAKKIDSLGFSKTAILVVRDQPSWMNSRYAHIRGMIRPVPEFEEFIADLVRKRNGAWFEFATHLEELGFEVHALPYTSEFVKQGAASAIMASSPLAGTAEVDASDSTKQSNVSLGEVGLILADHVRKHVRKMNPKLVSDPQLRWKVSKVVKNVSAGKFNDGSYNGLTPELVDRINQVYADGNERFAQKYLGRSWDETFGGRALRKVSPRKLQDLDSATGRQIRLMTEKILRVLAKREMV